MEKRVQKRKCISIGISRLVIDTVVVFYEIINQIVQSADIDVR